jgi:hypothetical protein
MPKADSGLTGETSLRMARVRCHNFTTGIHLAGSYQKVAPRIPFLEAEIDRLRQRQFELQMERNMSSYSLDEWSWQQEPDPPSAEETEILGQLVELSTQLCHDLKGMEMHSQVRLEAFGLDA